MCPTGCDMAAEIEGMTISAIEGAACNKGVEYVEQEILNPQRNIATSVLVEKGDIPIVSVRLTGTIPKARIFDVMAEVKKVRLTAPVKMGQVLIQNVLGLDCDVIATKNVCADSVINNKS